MTGFVEFFYNIIPGGLFIAAVYVTLGLKIDPSNTVITGSIFIILALFLGFFFQLLNDIFFKKKLQKAITENFRYGKSKNGEIDMENFKEAENRLKLLINYEKKYESLQSFYFMHNYLWAKEQNGLVELFNARVSLWANSAIASAIYAFLILTFSLLGFIQDTYLSLILISLASLMTLISYHFTSISLTRFYDAVLKTFLITTSLQKKQVAAVKS